MTDQFLTPVSDELRQFAAELDLFAIGSNIDFDNAVDENSIVIIGVYKNNNKSAEAAVDQFRRQFYTLKMGNWQLKVRDLGDLLPGATAEDSYFAFLKIQQELLKKKCTLIIIGDDPVLAYWQFRAFDSVTHQVNLTCVDNRFRLGNDSEELSEFNYLSKIITTDPHSLFDYTHLGHQTYFVAQEELDLMEELNFEVKRLGILTEKIQEAEPELRNSDMVMMNLESLQHSDFQSTARQSPNGFSAREICSLARYAGINNKVRSFGVYNFEAKNILPDNLLLAEIIWYFIEGKNHSAGDIVFENEKSYETFRVQMAEQELVFYRVIMSDQWWLELGNEEALPSVQHIIPCSSEDYQNSLKGKIPHRWWKAYKKLF